MTSDGLLIVECLFGTIWRLFTSWHIPGTTTTPAAFFMFIAVCGLALKFLYRIIGIYPDAGVTVGVESTPIEPLPDLQSGAPALGTRAWVSGNMRSHR